MSDNPLPDTVVEMNVASIPEVVSAVRNIAEALGIAITLDEPMTAAETGTESS